MRSQSEQQFYHALGQRVQQARRQAGLTQEELASLLDLTRTSVVNIEKGRQKVLSFTLVRLAQALRVTVQALLPTAADVLPLDQLLRDRPAPAQAFVRAVLASSPTKK